jgi:fatty-acyl-CoA synthase
MFISGGENVYPAEVELAIQQHPAVALAAVLGVPHPQWGEVGRAFVEVYSGECLTAEALKAWLRARLARFKIPNHISFSPAGTLPRTGSGKLDKPMLSRLPLFVDPS